jgi:hypothetical protein
MDLLRMIDVARARVTVTRGYMNPVQEAEYDQRVSATREALVFRGLDLSDTRARAAALAVLDWILYGSDHYGPQGMANATTLALNALVNAEAGGFGV